MFGKRREPTPSWPQTAELTAALGAFAAATGGPRLLGWERELPCAVEGPDAIPAGVGRILYLGGIRSVPPIAFDHLLVAVDPRGAVVGVVAAETAPHLHPNCMLGVFANGQHTNLGQQEALRGAAGFAPFMKQAMPIVRGFLQQGTSATGAPPRPDVRQTHPAPPAPAKPVPLDREPALRRLRELRRAAWRGGNPVALPRLQADLADLVPVLRALGVDQQAAAVERAAGAVTDPEALLAAGYWLVDLGLDELAIAPLGHAAAARHDHELSLTELVGALEATGQHAEAVQVLRGHPGLLASSGVCRALLSHDSAMTGDLTAVAELVGTLGGDEVGDTLRRIAELRLSRWHALRGACRLDEGDLRGWEAVLHGCLLLRFADVGEHVMNGRYAALWEQPDQFAQGLGLIIAALARFGRRPAVIVHAPDRDSEVLAWAISVRLGLGRPVSLDATVPAGGALLFAFDWSAAPQDALARLAPASVGSLGYSLDWTVGRQFAPDLAVLEAQAIFPPWGERQRMVGTPGTPGAQLETIPADARPPETIGREVAALTARPAESDLQGVAVVIDALLAARARCDLVTGERQAHYGGGPVRSAASD